MSCISGISSRQTPEQIALAKSQTLKHSKPRLTASKLRRLHKMSVSPDPNIRDAAAGNPCTPGEDLDWLASDPVDSVRSWVARNPNADERMLKALTVDKNPAIAAFAKWRLDAMV